MGAHTKGKGKRWEIRQDGPGGKVFVLWSFDDEDDAMVIMRNR